MLDREEESESNAINFDPVEPYLIILNAWICFQR